MHQNDPLYVESEELDFKVEEQLTKQFAATKNVDGEPFTSREVGTEYFSKQHRLKVESPAHQKTSHTVGVQSQKAPTSSAPEPYTENPLVTDVDTEIKEMAAEVREEVKSRDFVATGLHEKPFDPNLVCPMCGKKHRIGDIQKFRIHINQCDGVTV